MLNYVRGLSINFTRNANVISSMFVKVVYADYLLSDRFYF